MSKFKVEDKVLLNPESEWANVCGDSNPTDVCGTITEILPNDGSLNIIVLWLTGEDNSYRECDLLPYTGNILPTYTPEQLSEIELLQDRVDMLESLCSDYAKIIEEKDDRISSMQELIDELSSMGCTNGW